MEQNNLERDERQVMVSVCCPTYNHGKYIEKALQGFVSQITEFRYEVIVHEDASKDNTREILKKYAELYPDIIVPIYQDVNQYSQGRGRTFRNMLLKARGKYVAVCEGDDYWIDEYKLQKQYDALEANPECSICVHKIKQIMEDETLIEQANKRAKGIRNKYNLKTGIIEKERMAKALWLDGGYPFQTSCFFIRRNVLEARLHNTEPFLHYMTGDMVMLRLSLMHGKFYYLNDVMSCRRKGIGGSWSARQAVLSKKERAKYYKDFAIGESLYDKYSEYEFHKYIQQHVFNLLAEACVYSTEGIREQLKENPLSYKIVKDKETFWLYIRYCIMRVCPSFYKFLFEVQKKLLSAK